MAPRGCVNLGIEPKRGVVSLIIILEFGGVLYLNLGIAEGIVYLMAGIYIRKKLGKAELRAYIVCGGALSIIDIITASITFYLGMHGVDNNRALEGHCNVNYTVKISSFFEKTVQMSMKKRLDNQAGGQNASATNMKNRSADDVIVGDTVPMVDPVILNSCDSSELANEPWDEFFASYFRANNPH